MKTPTPQLHCLLLLAAVATFGCGATEGPEDADLDERRAKSDDSEELDDPGLGDQLDQAPYSLDLKAHEDRWSADLDLTQADPEHPPTLFVRSYGEPVYASVSDGKYEETLAEAKDAGKSEDDEGELQYFAKIEFDESILDRVRLDVELQVDRRLALWLCDEVVSNGNDSGAGSLRQAIADVRNGGSVCFDPMSFPAAGPVQLGAEILVGKDVTILGTTANGVRVVASGSERALQFGPSTSAVIKGVAFEGGEATEGGLIKSRGTLSMHGCSLGNSSADRGGAVHSSDILFFRDSSVSGSRAIEGGAMYCDDCRMYLDDASLSHNEAELGGALFGDSATIAVRDGTLVVNNTADQGGGMYLRGAGGISGYNRIDGGSVLSNTAQQGGGVYLEGTKVSVLRGPSGAGQPEAVASNIAVTGGGVYVEPLSVLEALGSASIYGNAAQQDGAGVFNEGSVKLRGAASISHNVAQGSGGGVANTGDVELFSSARIADNTARDTGGGVHHSSGLLKIWDSAGRITHNHADRGGGGVYNVRGMIDALSHEIVANAPDNIRNAP